LDRRNKQRKNRKHEAGDKHIEISKSKLAESASNSEASDNSAGGIEQEPFLEADAICSEHNLKIHSWHRRTKKHLCTVCIQK